MPDQPEHYRLGKNRKEKDFTTEPTPDYGVKGLDFEVAMQELAYNFFEMKTIPVSETLLASEGKLSSETITKSESMVKTN